VGPEYRNKQSLQIRLRRELSVDVYMYISTSEMSSEIKTGWSLYHKEPPTCDLSDESPENENL